jgi:hypothetical protein
VSIIKVRAWSCLGAAPQPTSGDKSSYRRFLRDGKGPVAGGGRLGHGWQEGGAGGAACRRGVRSRGRGHREESEVAGGVGGDGRYTKAADRSHSPLYTRPIAL